MSAYKCSYLNCDSKYYGRIGLRMFRFPWNTCQIWVQNSGNPGLVGLSAQKLHEIGRICEKHFKPQDISPSGRLVKGAVPIPFSCQSESKLRNSGNLSKTQPKIIIHSRPHVERDSEGELDALDFNQKKERKRKQTFLLKNDNYEEPCGTATSANISTSSTIAETAASPGTVMCAATAEEAASPVISNSHTYDDELECEESKLVIEDDELEREEPKLVIEDDELEHEESKLVIEDDELEREESKLVIEDDELEVEESEFVIKKEVLTPKIDIFAMDSSQEIKESGEENVSKTYDTAGVNQGNASVCSTNSKVTNELSPSTLPVKRKRGRPRKPIDPNAPPKPVPTVKRKRGRPRKENRVEENMSEVEYIDLSRPLQDCSGSQDSSLCENINDEHEIEQCNLIIKTEIPEYDVSDDDDVEQNPSSMVVKNAYEEEAESILPDVIAPTLKPRVRKAIKIMKKSSENFVKKTMFHCPLCVGPLNSRSELGDHLLKEHPNRRITKMIQKIQSANKSQQEKREEIGELITNYFARNRWDPLYNSVHSDIVLDPTDFRKDSSSQPSVSKTPELGPMSPSDSSQSTDSKHSPSVSPEPPTIEPSVPTVSKTLSGLVPIGGSNQVVLLLTTPPTNSPSQTPLLPSTFSFSPNCLPSSPQLPTQPFKLPISIIAKPNPNIIEQNIFSVLLSKVPVCTRVALKKKLTELVDAVAEGKVNPQSIFFAYSGDSQKNKKNNLCICNKCGLIKHK